MFYVVTPLRAHLQRPVKTDIILDERILAYRAGSVIFLRFFRRPRARARWAWVNVEHQRRAMEGGPRVWRSTPAHNGLTLILGRPDTKK